MADDRIDPNESLRLLVRLLRCAQAVKNHFRSRLDEEYGTTLAKWDTIATLARYPEGLTMSKLSESMMVSNGNVTQLVDRLKKDGFVARVVQGNDRRFAKAILTKKGRAVFDEIATANKRWIDETLADMDARDVTRLTTLLGKLRRSVDYTAKRKRG